jgi:hypothetical protein
MLTIKRSRIGQLIVDGFAWPKEQEEKAKGVSKICRESRRSSLYCTCTACQVTKFLKEEENGKER